MEFSRIFDDHRADRAYRTVFSAVTERTTPQKAVVGFHSGNVHCRVAWNAEIGLWLMYPPKSWDRRQLVFGTQNPELHRSRSLSITVQINIGKGAAGRERAGAVLSGGRGLYLAHNGGIGGGKEGIGKSAFLSWYREQVAEPVIALDGDGMTPYILIGKIGKSTAFLYALRDFVHAVYRFKKQRDVNESVDEHLSRDADEADEEGAFDPGTIDDEPGKVLRSINVRRGQPDFRKRLLKVYGGRCAISGCDCEDALEAAHIRRYGGEDTNHIQNGLLLRCDLHTLFDIGKLGIDPDTYRIVVADALLETVYSRLKGKKLRLPVNPKHHPNTNVLREHLNTWELIG